MTMLTIEEIARLANISRSTVSRVLNNHPNVRPAVRERVLRVINEQGYAPSAAAQSLASRRTRVIGLLIPSTVSEIFSDPFFGAAIQGITEAATQSGYFVMLSMVTVDMEKGFYERILRSRHFDGVLMLSSHIDDPILPLLRRDKVPLVLIGNHPYFQDLTWVDAEQREGAHQAVTHFISLGHRRIASITGPLYMVAGLERRDGYKQGLLEAGLPILPELIEEGNWTQQSGYNAMQKLLRLPHPPTAVFVASDTMALGAIRAVHEAGRTIPDDVATISFDDLPVATYSNPPLSTIRQPITEMGALAVKLLIDQIDHAEPRGQHIRLPTELVIRASCGTQRTNLEQNTC